MKFLSALCIRFYLILFILYSIGTVLTYAIQSTCLRLELLSIFLSSSLLFFLPSFFPSFLPSFTPSFLHSLFQLEQYSIVNIGTSSYYSSSSSNNNNSSSIIVYNAFLLFFYLFSRFLGTDQKEWGWRNGCTDILTDAARKCVVLIIFIML